MRRSFGPIAVLFALSATPAFAQDPAARRELAPDVAYDFEDHEVGGGRYTPEGTEVFGRRRGQRASLIRPRVHFVPELLKTVERL